MSGFSSALRALAVMTAAVLSQPALAEDTPYLHVIYHWSLPMFPGCAATDAYSAYVPFTVKGKKVASVYDFHEFDEVLPELVPDPRGSLHRIEYSATCGACTISGELIVHSLRGRVVKRGGKDMLRLTVTYSEPVCMTDCPGQIQDIDCSYSEQVEDEFIIPFKDGAILDRPPNAKLKYAVHLK